MSEATTYDEKVMEAANALKYSVRDLKDQTSRISVSYKNEIKFRGGPGVELCESLGFNPTDAMDRALDRVCQAVSNLIGILESNDRKKQSS